MQYRFKWGKERNLILEGSILPMHGRKILKKAVCSFSFKEEEVFWDV